MLFSHIHFYQRPSSLTIAVSGCLNGDAVRYDGGHKHTPIITAFISQYATLLPLCPEAGAGFGTPRPPMQLIQTDNGIEAHRIDDNKNLTPALKMWSEKTAATLTNTIDGAILKKRSPSCGIQSTPLYDQNANVFGTTSGLFAAQLEQYPLILADEEQINTEQQALDFLLRCYLLKESRQTNEAHLLAHYQPVTNINNLHEWQTWLCDLSKPLPF